MATVFVIIGAILGIILWNKKINPDTTWIYAIYVIIVVFIYLFATIIL